MDVCNHDCFRCPHADCINDSPPIAGELPDADEKALKKKRNPDKVKEYQKAYYRKNRDRIRAKTRAYYYSNHERCIAAQRERYKKKSALTAATAKTQQRVDNPNNKVILPPTDKFVK